jgi:predicted nucleic acid-binding protein
MKVYLDSSAIVQFVNREEHSVALASALLTNPEDEYVASALSVTEVVRAAQPFGVLAVERARRFMDALHKIAVSNEILREAGSIAPGSLLRTLDAIHLATARQVGSDLRMLVTYDRRLAEIATTNGVAVVSPR